ncbi:hypothetical protein ACWEVP_24815 [Amycolatopsis sp. NPDC003865]
MADEPVTVPNFRGRQALKAWHPLLNGTVVAQLPAAGARVAR